MLDQATKRRIDNARDILVGKVPDPKSQVEQITIALIYKFMDDMDKESEEWGGEATFFTGEYEKYAWSRIFDPRLGGFDLISLYSEALIKMNQNPNIPQLFRDIFKNAYLPYRDPETLKSFLKEINEFTYDHSERLGDAFEYLLSAMDSQGEAGQFRTPRHIIDFIVEIVDPKKNETVLDPACGTAGFLISSYKHILRANTKDRSGDQLNPDDKKRLMNNFMGYDISPDMVRLSLVNLYLHSFSDPKIHEYDTLTSEERWDETADVILANPPFMTPKGGIRPHKRFSIQAKRSEVLFVDYIAEHLNPNGRAGVIVPEGIIFQSQTAYKNLRKILVEDFLWAVVSMPAGVFQPYSGVKTSILLMDKMMAKKIDKILFVKIESDGFNLGAQRRPIDKNDLPKALDYLKNYFHSKLNNTVIGNTDFANPVEKARIAKDRDWNLSVERYRDDSKVEKAHYEMVQIGELCEIFSGSRPKGGAVNKGILSIGGEHINPDGSFDLSKPKYIPNDYFDILKKGKIEIGDVLVVKDGATTGKVGYYNEYAPFRVGAVNEHVFILRANIDKVLPYYLYSMLRSNQGHSEILKFKVGAAQGGINLSVKALQIPLPSLDMQKAIVTEISGYQKIIDGARQVVDNYKPTIEIDPEWEMVEIKSISKLITKGSSPRWQGVNYVSKDKGILFITSENIGSNKLILKNQKYVERKFNDIQPRSILKKGDVLTNIVGASIGRTAIYDLDVVANINQAVCIIRPDESKINRKFLVFYMNMPSFINRILESRVENARANISMGVLGRLIIPLPPLSVQKEIVAQIEAEQEIVNANKRLIEIYERKIKDKIAEVWGEKS